MDVLIVTLPLWIIDAMNKDIIIGLPMEMFSANEGCLNWSVSHGTCII